MCIPSSAQYLIIWSLSFWFKTHEINNNSALELSILSFAERKKIFLALRKLKIIETIITNGNESPGSLYPKQNMSMLLFQPTSFSTQNEQISFIDQLFRSWRASRGKYFISNSEISEKQTTRDKNIQSMLIVY